MHELGIFTLGVVCGMWIMVGISWAVYLESKNDK